MNNIDKQYQALLQDILDNGVRKGDRTGTGTISVFGRQIRHKMSEGFPLITTKKMHWKSIVTELLWFLRGDTNIKYLVENGCHIWDGDAYKNYVKKSTEDHVIETHKEVKDVFIHPELITHVVLSLPEFIERIKTDSEFAAKWGELGSIYGHQWRKWNQYTDVCVDNDFGNGEYGGCWTLKQIDQISNLIDDLKHNPDSRRLMVSAWNVGEIDSMVLPPCHYGFQVWTRELSLEERMKLVSDGKYKVKHELDFVNGTIPRRAISLMWNQRSVDTFLGLPFNIASYALLLEIIAKEVNMIPDEIIGNLGDTHLYSNHIEQAKEQIGRELTWEEQVQWVMKNTDVEMENLYITEEVYKDSTPKRTRQPFPLPKLRINTEFWKTESGECGIGLLNTNLKGFEISDFQIENYQSHPAIKAPLSN
jgi:thymidylate synthase